MDITIIALISFVLIVYIIKQLTKQPKKITSKTPTVYKYNHRESPMSPSEIAFFHALNNAVSDRYYVFPQVHLSSIFDHKVSNGQDWKHALQHINSKSVDYILCDKNTLKTVYAIELDDYTHERPDRRARDAEVERIFTEADVSLVRFPDKNINKEQIIAKLVDTMSKQMENH